MDTNCETLMPLFPNISRIGLAFNFDLNIDRGHLLVKDYLPAKLLWQSVLELSVAQGVGDQHDL